MWKHKSLPCSLPQLNHNLFGQGTGIADHLTLLRHFSPFSFSCRISPPSLSHSHAVKLYILFFATFGVSLLDRLALDIRVLLLDCVFQMWDFFVFKGWSMSLENEMRCLILQFGTSIFHRCKTFLPYFDWSCITGYSRSRHLFQGDDEWSEFPDLFFLRCTHKSLPLMCTLCK